MNRIIAFNFILKASLIYGAIVLMVMCLTVLALQQLLDEEKNNYRFSVLRKMGVEEKDLHTLVLKQLGVWFGMPITAAIVVAIIVIGYFLQSVSAEISAYCIWLRSLDAANRYHCRDFRYAAELLFSQYMAAVPAFNSQQLR